MQRLKGKLEFINRHDQTGADLTGSVPSVGTVHNNCSSFLNSHFDFVGYIFEKGSYILLNRDFDMEWRTDPSYVGKSFGNFR